MISRDIGVAALVLYESTNSATTVLNITHSQVTSRTFSIPTSHHFNFECTCVILVPKTTEKLDDANQKHVPSTCSHHSSLSCILQADPSNIRQTTAGHQIPTPSICKDSDLEERTQHSDRSICIGKVIKRKKKLQHTRTLKSTQSTTTFQTKQKDNPSIHHITTPPSSPSPSQLPPSTHPTSPP
jgi:hypothetical protein